MTLGYPTPTVLVDRKPRCPRCSKVVAWLVARPWCLQCRHCRATVRSEGFPAPLQSS